MSEIETDTQHQKAQNKEYADYIGDQQPPVVTERVVPNSGHVDDSEDEENDVERIERQQKEIMSRINQYTKAVDDFMMKIGDVDQMKAAFSSPAAAEPVNDGESTQPAWQEAVIAQRRKERHMLHVRRSHALSTVQAARVEATLEGLETVRDTAGHATVDALEEDVFTTLGTTMGTLLAKKEYVAAQLAREDELTVQLQGFLRQMELRETPVDVPAEMGEMVFDLEEVGDW